MWKYIQCEIHESFGKDVHKVTIEQIDEDGAILEKWNLQNAWVKELTWGELDYSSDELTECTIKFRYDFAEFIATSDADATASEVGPFFSVNRGTGTGTGS